MFENSTIKMTIIIDDGQARKAAKNLQKSQDETEKRLKKGSKARTEWWHSEIFNMKSFAATMFKASVSMIGVLAIWNLTIVPLEAAIQGLINAIKGFISIMGNMETAIISIKTVLASSVRYVQDFSANFVIAGEVAEAVVFSLMERTGELVGSFEDAVLVFQTLVGQGAGSLVRNTRELVDVSILLTNAIISVTPGQEKQRQLASETAALLRGQVRATDRLAKLLGLSAGKLKEMRVEWEKSKNFADQMKVLLRAFAEAAEEYARSWAGVTTTLRDYAKIIIVTAFKPLWQDFMQSMIAFKDFLGKHSREIINILQPLSAGFRVVWEDIAKALNIEWDEEKFTRWAEAVGEWVVSVSVEFQRLFDWIEAIAGAFEFYNKYFTHRLVTEPTWITDLYDSWYDLMESYSVANEDILAQIHEESSYKLSDDVKKAYIAFKESVESALSLGYEFISNRIHDLSVIFADLFTQWKKNAKSALAEIKVKAKDDLKFDIEITKQSFNDIKAKFTDLFNFIKKGIFELNNFLSKPMSEVFNSIFDNIYNTFISLMDKIKSQAKTISKEKSLKVKADLDFDLEKSNKGLLDNLNNIGNRLKVAWSEAFTAFDTFNQETLKNITDKIWKFDDALTNLNNTAVEWEKRNIWSYVEDFLGITAHTAALETYNRKLAQTREQIEKNKKDLDAYLDMNIMGDTPWEQQMEYLKEYNDALIKSVESYEKARQAFQDQQLKDASAVEKFIVTTTRAFDGYISKIDARFPKLKAAIEDLKQATITLGTEQIINEIKLQREIEKTTALEEEKLRKLKAQNDIRKEIAAIENKLKGEPFVFQAEIDKDFVKIIENTSSIQEAIEQLEKLKELKQIEFLRDYIPEGDLWKNLFGDDPKEVLDQFNVKVDDVIKNLKKLRANLNIMKDFGAAARINLDTEFLENVTKKWEKFGDVFTGTLMYMAQTAVTQFGNAFAQMITDLITGSDDALRNVGKFLGAMLIQLGQMVISMGVMMMIMTKFPVLWPFVGGPAGYASGAALIAAGTAAVALGALLGGGSSGSAGRSTAGGGASGSTEIPEFAFDESQIRVQMGMINATNNLVMAVDSLTSKTPGVLVKEGAAQNGGIIKMTNSEAHSNTKGARVLGASLLGRGNTGRF